MEALGGDVPLSEGAKHLVASLKEPPEPLWVLNWGGANVLAQALQYIHATESSEDRKTLRSRIRAYAISDQDDCGVWIRTTYPDIFYICSLHGWSQYRLAAWMGISGNVDGSGPDSSPFTRQWLAKNIQIGPLGKNGPGAPEHPEWGSWGGRYIGPDFRGTVCHYTDAVDSVIGKDGETYTSNHATIWRWREAFQNDFAARMQWTLTNDPKRASHQPVVTVNGSTGPEPLMLEIEPGEVVHPDASDSYDPDGGSLSFSWFQYREPTMNQAGLHPPQVRDVKIQNTDDSQHRRKVKLQMPSAVWCAIDCWSGANKIKKVFVVRILGIRVNMRIEILHNLPVCVYNLHHVLRTYAPFHMCRGTRDNTFCIEFIAVDKVSDERLRVVGLVGDVRGDEDAGFC